MSSETSIFDNVAVVLVNNMTVTDPIKDKFNELVQWREPKYLYHYTDFESLEKIVSTSEMRATHRSFLNDKTDLKHGSDACIQFAQEWGERQHTRIGGDLAQAVVARLCEMAEPDAFSYSASFTEEGDSAAQWQVYGRYGRGVSLCFDFQKLKQSLMKAEFSDGEGKIFGPHFFLHKTEYDTNVQREQVVQLLDAAVSCWDEASGFFEKPLERLAYSTCFFLDHLATRTFKHRGHMHEQEWKAIPNVAGDDFVEFSTSKQSMRPYLKMKFDLQGICAVVVGSAVPQPFEDIKSVFTLFWGKHGLGNVKVKRSEILLSPSD